MNNNATQNNGDDIRKLLFKHYSSINSGTKKNSTSCPKTEISMEKAMLNVANKNCEIKELKILLEEETAKVDQIFQQCSPNYREDKNKIITRKTKQNQYYEQKKHHLYGEKELKRRINEFIPLREDHYNEDKERGMNYSAFVHGIRKFYWPNGKKIKKLDEVEIPQENFMGLSYPTTDENGVTIWIYRYEKINVCYPAILRYAKKKLDDMKFEAQKQNYVDPTMFGDINNPMYNNDYINPISSQQQQQNPFPSPFQQYQNNSTSSLFNPPPTNIPSKVNIIVNPFIKRINELRNEKQHWTTEFEKLKQQYIAAHDLAKKKESNTQKHAEIDAYYYHEFDKEQKLYNKKMKEIDLQIEKLKGKKTIRNEDEGIDVDEEPQSKKPMRIESGPSSSSELQKITRAEALEKQQENGDPPIPPFPEFSLPDLIQSHNNNDNDTNIPLPTTIISPSSSQNNNSNNSSSTSTTILPITARNSIVVQTEHEIFDTDEELDLFIQDLQASKHKYKQAFKQNKNLVEELKQKLMEITKDRENIAHEALNDIQFVIQQKEQLQEEKHQLKQVIEKVTNWEIASSSGSSNTSEEKRKRGRPSTLEKEKNNKNNKSIDKFYSKQQKNNINDDDDYIRD